MGAAVLNDNTYVNDELLRKGTARSALDPNVAGLVGDHLWSDQQVEPNVAPDGEALRGLKDNVYGPDGTLYRKGTFPPAGVAAALGDHLWVEGSKPSASEPAPTVEPSVPVPPVVPADSSRASGGNHGTPQPPPQGGPKGSARAWHEYAAAVGVEVDADAKRDDVIDAVKAAGKLVE